jgi:hypothetical protein
MALPSSRVSQLLTKLAVPPNKGLEWTAHSAERDRGDIEIQNWPERFPDLWRAAAQAQAVRLLIGEKHRMRENNKPPKHRMPKSAEELLQRYAERERDFAAAEMDGSNHNFQNSILAGADFSHSFIIANFHGANLKQAVFVSANIKTCDFRKADLEGADFSGAALEGTQFDGANLNGARFDGASCFSYTMKLDEKPWW